MTRRAELTRIDQALQRNYLLAVAPAERAGTRQAIGAAETAGVREGAIGHPRVAGIVEAAANAIATAAALARHEVTGSAVAAGPAPSLVLKDSRVSLSALAIK